MYDGYTKYGESEAADYEEERKKEPLWWQEQRFLQDYLAGIQHRTILDAPVGTGRFLQHYHGLTHVVGIDISHEMLEQAAEKVREHELKNVRLKCGDIFAIQYDDSYFDLTISWRFIHLLPADLLAAALRELARVTAGEVVVQAYVVKPYWQRLIYAGLRLPLKLIKRLSMSRAPPLPWEHIKAYSHSYETILSKVAEAGLVVNKQVIIGDYRDSQVCVFQLGKLI